MSCSQKYVTRFQASILFIPLDGFLLDLLIPVAANDVAFSTHAVLLTAFTLFQIAIYDRGNQKVSKICIAIVSVAWLAAAVFVFIALPSHSWLLLVSCFNTLQVVMTTIKYIPQVSIFFDLLFIVQHYVLYPAKKTALSPDPDTVSQEPFLKSSECPDKERF
ncbi:hypothetical protein RHMOL_Rhmol10G0017200 [Rhododendron molle]|uniref:Uncharacterized protein n=1 Tax=Rhododendron molle TaxID=49168 RepID=A0ACC0LXP9_RHOML|nr:hypothetical protein RHMOL_Rhmol10G0017200 [Rhododendron molle]